MQIDEQNELCRWIEKAILMRARHLFLTAGKRPAIRREKKVVEIANEEMLHIWDISSLVHKLLTAEEFSQLEEKGDIQIKVKMQNAKSEIEKYVCSVSKSVGSYILVIDLKSKYV